MEDHAPQSFQQPGAGKYLRGGLPEVDDQGKPGFPCEICLGLECQGLFPCRFGRKGAGKAVEAAFPDGGHQGVAPAGEPDDVVKEVPGTGQGVHADAHPQDVISVVRCQLVRECAVHFPFLRRVAG